MNFDIFFSDQQFIYFVVVHVVAKPKEEYVTSFNYLGKKQDSCLYKTFNICGER